MRARLTTLILAAALALTGLLAAPANASTTYTYAWSSIAKCFFNPKDYLYWHVEVETRHSDNAIRIIRGGAWGSEQITGLRFFENTASTNHKNGYPTWYPHKATSYQTPYMWHGDWLHTGHYRYGMLDATRNGGILPTCGAHENIYATWGYPTP